MHLMKLKMAGIHYLIVGSLIRYLSTSEVGTSIFFVSAGETDSPRTC